MPLKGQARQRIGMPRANVYEVNVEAVDRGDELRQRVQLRFHLAPVVMRRPITREPLHRSKLHTLRCVRDRFPLGPTRRVDAPPQIDELCIGHVYVQLAKRVVISAADAGDIGEGLRRLREGHAAQRGCCDCRGRYADEATARCKESGFRVRHIVSFWLHE